MMPRETNVVVCVWSSVDALLSSQVYVQGKSREARLRSKVARQHMLPCWTNVLRVSMVVCRSVALLARHVYAHHIRVRAAHTHTIADSKSSLGCVSDSVSQGTWRQ